MLVELPTVGSTNDWVAEAAITGAADGLWVRADLQTGGRGRRGRAWVSEPGNLFASTLVRDLPGQGPPQQLSFISALALADGLDRYVQPGRIALKWPNDVLLDGVKCAGILLERSGEATIIGFGVNLAHHPSGTERPATSLAASGIAAPHPSAFLDGVRSAFSALRSLWRERGFEPVRTAWLARAGGLGGRITARLGAETVDGAFEDLAADGGLLLRLEGGGLRTIHAGEVFSLPA